MTDPADLALPFLTSDMLRFKTGTTYTLVVNTRSMDGSPLYITGISREGPFTYKIVPSSDGSVVSNTFRLSDFPIFLSATNPITTVYKNGVYIDVSVQINGDVMMSLMSGYVYSSKALSWPSATMELATPNDLGYRIERDSTDPAAGAEMSYSLPANRIYHIRSIKITLVTDATVANRRVHLNVLESNGGTMEFISSVDQPASTTRTYWFEPISGLGTYADDNDIIVPIIDNIWVRGGTLTRTQTTNIQAGDNYGIANHWMEEFMKDGA